MSTILNEYRTHLWGLIHPEKGGSDPTSLLLFDTLDSVVFRALVQEDANRVADVINMRRMWCEAVGFDIHALDDKPCSLLEVMLILSETLSYMLYGSTKDSSEERWFNEMCQNLGILGADESTIRERAERMVARGYDENGNGGLFPLKNPKEDQRKVEVWMQLNAYIIEKFM